MDTRLRSYSHTIVTKIIVFIITIFCFTSAITAFINIVEVDQSDLDIAFENNYYESSEFMWESRNLIKILTRLMEEYKNKDYILNGGTITDDEIIREEENLFSDFRDNSKSYNPELSREENYKVFREKYADKISQIKDRLIKEDIREYNSDLKALKEYEGAIYYVSDGANIFTNSTDEAKSHFKSYPSYIIFDDSERAVFPKEIIDSKYYHGIDDNTYYLDNKNITLYLSFSDEFLNPRIKEWKEDKGIVMENTYRIAAFVLGLIVSFVFLLIIIGKKSFKDKEVHLNFIDKLYNEFNLAICISLIVLWFGAMKFILYNDLYKFIFPVTMLIGTLGLIFVLSLFRHIKNGTIIKHTLIFTILYKLYKFIKDVYDSGSVGVKIVAIVVGYPILAALTFFMFPVTIGVAAWLALKKVREFNEIKEGVEKIKNGYIYHTIDVSGKGEFGKLAENINSITDGLNKAVDNELKSERLKTELITNVSHDIRTPLTSIITYVDLLKREEDIANREEYIEIIEQKSHRLKVLTDDLFEAAKASSGSIPVNYEKIDIVSLITQGLGELNDKIEERNLEFKIIHPEEKLYVKADGKLLWRVIENLLSNIFKYALQGSRVYIEIKDIEDNIRITLKNISCDELNISSNELMERFKRGDESRTSEGSGLGLSIAKSLVDVQKGSFDIEIDGDLFKAVIKIPKYKGE
ncbi:histidine kinase dimerization/phospho-acceptor domain-containing protein [Wukongibacter sp. M2B1]|uniref:sensor histidine kinase n=1 Tax=Wukongibacter sp. M2B1 TaxID=3088895 RepID=UPI003D7AE896